MEGMALIFLAMVGLVVTIWYWSSKLLKIVCLGLLVLSPFALVNIGSAAWTVFSVTASDVAAAPTIPTKAHRAVKQRVVWLLFDELDQRAVFEKRPKEIKLSALDALYSESFAATSVEQVGKNTITAIPGMTTGKPVVSAHPASANSLMLSFAEGNDTGPKTDWRETKNVFSNIHRFGGRTGIVGTYHPYCRTFSAFLATCKHVFLGTASVENRGGFQTAFTERLMTINPLYRRKNAVSAYKIALEHSKVMAADVGLDFVYIHVALPHQPTIMDAASGKLSYTHFGPDGYFNNLVAVDRFLAEIRAEMEKRGVWNSTVVIVSADHAWRASRAVFDGKVDTRVPLIVKLTGNIKPARYEGSLSGSVMNGLVEALSLAEITQGQDLRQWFNSFRKRARGLE